MSRLVVAVVVVALSSAAEAKPRRRLPPGTELTLAQLGWPATTKSLRAPAIVKVYREPGHSERWGKLATGTRVGWKRAIVVRNACRMWVEIEPKGWVCSSELAPSDDAPLAVATIDPGAILERVLAKPFIGVTPEGTRAYDSVDAIRHGRAAKKLDGWSFLRLPIATASVGGQLFYRTMHGYVSALSTMPRPASAFGGIDLVATPPPGWPFAWVMAKRDERIAARSHASPSAATVRTLGRRDLVRIFESKHGFARVGTDEWIPLRDLRIARLMMRPHGVRDGERWIDVDLDQQTMIAYEGDQPVYATLVSTGKAHSTPTAIHRIRKKHALTRLKSPSVALGTWDMPDVPFSMAFRKYYAAHASYWHDGFGAERSQGCVNLAPRDARWLFDWTLPHVPAGWIEGSAYRDEGTPIRLRDRRDPDPRWTEHDVPPPPSVKLRD